MTIERPKLFWLGISFAFSIFYSLLALKVAFSSEYMVQDDARQHVFWMMRFVDRDLFPNDLIADYFQSVAPWGYKTLYQLAASVGIDPFFFNKIIPPFIGLITTFYCFNFSLQILPIPATAFLSSLLFNQNLWMKDDLVSATPRAFAYAFLLAFLYYLSRRSLVPCLIVIVFMGIVYPHCIFLACGLLIFQLFKVREKKIYLSQNSQDYRFCFLGLAIAFIVMLPYALDRSVFDPVISVERAKQLPEFLAGGRTEFFVEEPLKYWIYGKRSGILPSYSFIPLTLVAGLFLPLLLKFRDRFPLARRIQADIVLIPQLLGVSLAMFLIAHALLFKLHLPNRYTAYSFRIAIALATGITLSLILHSLWQGLKKSAISFLSVGKLLRLGLIIFILGTAIYYPHTLIRFPVTLYVKGSDVGLYEFLKQQPKDILIASLAEDTNSNLPSFTQRSIFVGREQSIPYHWGYYSQFRQRIIDLIEAEYSSDLDELKQFITTYKIDLFLLDRETFNPRYLSNDGWLKQFQPYVTEVQQKLERGETPAIANFMEDCAVFSENNLVVLDANCIAK